MLRQRRQENIPALITSASRLLVQQRQPSRGQLPAVLLQKLSDQPPPARLISLLQQATKPRQRQRLVHTATIIHPATLLHARPRSEEPTSKLDSTHSQCLLPGGSHTGTFAGTISAGQSRSGPNVPPCEPPDPDRRRPSTGTFDQVTRH